MPSKLTDANCRCHRQICTINQTHPCDPVYGCEVILSKFTYGYGQGYTVQYIPGQDQDHFVKSFLLTLIKKYHLSCSDSSNNICSELLSQSVQLKVKFSLNKLSMVNKLLQYPLCRTAFLKENYEKIMHSVIQDLRLRF